MPIPFAAAASLAAIVGATQDCENHSDDEQHNKVNHNNSNQHDSTATTCHAGAATVLSSEDVDDPFSFSPRENNTSSIRSIEYESSQSLRNFSRRASNASLVGGGRGHGAAAMLEHQLSFQGRALPTSRVVLPTVSTEHDELNNDNNNNNNSNINDNAINNNSNTATYDCSYLDGSFHSGLVACVTIQNGCFATAVGPPGCGLWAVGTLGAIQLYATANHVLVATIQLPSGFASTNSMVSALAWLDHKPIDGRRLTLVTTTLQGHVSVYTIDPELLEVEGGGIVPLPGGMWTLGKEVRSVAIALRGNMVTAAVGDAAGRLHLFSWPIEMANYSGNSNNNINSTGAVSLTHECKQLSTSNAILQVVWDEHGRHLAVATQSGAVDVYRVGLASSKSIGGGGSSSSNKGNMATSTTQFVWSTQRAGPVRALVWQGTSLALGGYDKTCIVVDTRVWGIAREIVLEGTVNALSFDQFGRYLAVGCRDKSLTLLDTSTWKAIKSWGTAGWVTSITWVNTDRVVLRSARKSLSVLDLTPTQYSATDRRLFATPTLSATSAIAAAWLDAQRVVRSVGKSLMVADASHPDMDTLTSWSTPSLVQCIVVNPVSDGRRLATVDSIGRLSVWETDPGNLLQSVMSEAGLRAIAWSLDGKLLATGGKQKMLHVWNVHEDSFLERATDEPLSMNARIWDLAFAPNEGLLAVALGDYTAVLLSTSSWIATLQIARSRTVRCCTFHPQDSLVVIGDGAGAVCIVDYSDEEVLHDFDAGSRVNTLAYSPQGDYLLIGNDDSHFTLHHSSTYQCVQEFHTSGYAVTAAFSPGGTHLVLGSGDGSYGLVRLGPFLGIDLVPLSLLGGISDLPPWALAEVLYRSANGPSFVQRHMMKGGSDNLRRVSMILQQFPGALYTYNRETADTFFHTALRMKKPHLLKLVVTAMVNGSLDRIDERSSVLTTSYPKLGRQAMDEIVNNYSAEMAGEIFQAMTFLKVPFAAQRLATTRRERASNDFRDPWSKRCLREDWQQSKELGSLDPTITKATSLARKEELHAPGEPWRTPAVLPMPGLGEMDFLSSLLSFARAEIWDNEAMALVLRVMWKDHIRKYFIVDFILYLALCVCWVALLEAELVSSSLPDLPSAGEEALRYGTFALNSLFALKETVEARYGRRPGYFRSFWNAVDILAVSLIYAYLFYQWANENGSAAVPLAVVSTLVSTMKLLSYLRGFGQTGWLISVLGANFWDVRGFLVVLLTILIGFAVAFRLLFAEISQEAFGSLRRSFLSTFELTIVGSYEPDLLYNSEENALAIFTFILAVTCCLVVTLNALISLLSDSYARIMEHATANRRKERAGLIVEYMSLLPPQQRRKIEDQTQWFHTLLESDSDGELKVNRDDWEGGLNALRRDMEELDAASRKNQDKLFQQLKTDVEAELGSFRKEVLNALGDLRDDVRQLKLHQKQGGITLSGKGVKHVVKAVRSIGKQTSLFARDSNS